MSELTHVAKDGAVRMVDVTGKPVTHREAVASGEIAIRPETIRLIAQGSKNSKIASENSPALS